MSKKSSKFEFKRRDISGQLETVGYMALSDQGKGAAELHFYGDIVADNVSKWSPEDLCPAEIAQFLDGIEPGRDLNIYFNSGGGDVFAGIAIYNQLMRHTGARHGYVDGLCASIATIILMSCDEAEICRGAQLMIHDPWSWGMGNAKDFRKRAEQLDLCREKMLDIYMTRAAKDVTREQLAEMMDAETWGGAEKFKEIFGNITVSDAFPAAAWCGSAFGASYAHMPTCDTESAERQRRAEAQALLDDLCLYGA